MNFALSREIYGLNPWCMDEHSLPALMSTLNSIRSGVKLELPEEKYNSIHFLNLASNETKLIKNTWSLNNSEDFKGIGIINLDGVITVSGGASSYGVDYLKSQMLVMSRDSRVKSFIVRGNSGGGSSMAVEILGNTIKEVNKTKPVYGSIKEGGMMASACFGIMSYCKAIYAESDMSVVGSAGTMIQFEGRKANSEHNGVKYIRMYAPKSTHKNKGFEDALNNDDYTVLIDNVLKPFNTRFLSLLESNRPQLKGSNFENGHTTLAKDAIGTFIDGLKTFEEVIEIASSEITTENNNNNFNTNNKNKKMTKADFKAANPTGYAEIVAEGVSAEKDRAGSWLAHVNTDSKAVIAGIESGLSISQSQRENFFVKQNSINTAKGLKANSAGDVVTPESQSEEEIKKTKLDQELKKAFDFDL